MGFFFLFNINPKGSEHMKDGMLDVQKRIEAAYQRAMNIRDISPVPPPASVSNDYDRAYRKHYRTGDAKGFITHTRRFLKVLHEQTRIYRLGVRHGKAR